jgi:TRAP transporter 4TM/12TM fusion protein
MADKEKLGITKAFPAKVVIVLSVIWGTYQLIATRYFLFSPQRHNNIHLIMAVAVTFLMLTIDTQKEKKAFRIPDLIGFLLLLISAIYIHTEYLTIIIKRPYVQSTGDTLIGIFIIIGILYFAYRKWGITIPVLCIISLFYLYYGKLLEPGSIFFHGGVKFKRLIAIQTTFFSGVYGNLLETSATTVVVYVLFGAILIQMGALDIVIDAIKLIAGEGAAASAQMAVLGSAAFGTISGASAANVSVTGVITIPMMKRNGFLPHYAAAIESLASTGGGIMPPIMSATAFLLASLARCSYLDVVVVAILPAILFYGSMALQVQLYCKKYKLSSTKNKLDKRYVVKQIALIIGRRFYVIIAFCALIFFMGSGVSVIMTGLYAILIAFITRFVSLLIERKNLFGAIKKIISIYYKSMYDGCVMMASITIIMACLGIFVEATIATGLGNRLSFLLMNMSNGSLYLLLIIMALVCMFLGCGLPTIPSYLLVAVIGAPVLKSMGIPVILAHYFVLYYANLSQITPPVGITSLIASKIADTSYLKTGLASIKLCLPILVIPMLLVLYPGIAGISYAKGYADFFITILLTLLCIVPICFAAEGFIFSGLNIGFRVLLCCVGLSVLTKNSLIISIGITVFAVILLINYIQKSRSGGVLEVKVSSLAGGRKNAADKPKAAFSC